ncbi:uncharacterized protein LOC143149824 isoform X2 [Ptiloglossa arizonensis]|uniref:uncharacterized protein LOC143149824 isoform X2 n=1 Tax=Ptiloglossa arizonensis TaxID=3350558 RepID=UPI003FA0E2B5
MAPRTTDRLDRPRCRWNVVAVAVAVLARVARGVTRDVKIAHRDHRVQCQRIRSKKKRKSRRSTQREQRLGRKIEFN